MTGLLICWNWSNLACISCNFMKFGMNASKSLFMNWVFPAFEFLDFSQNLTRIPKDSGIFLPRILPGSCKIMEDIQEIQDSEQENQKSTKPTLTPAWWKCKLYINTNMQYIMKHYTIYYNLIHKQFIQLYNCDPIWKPLCYVTSSQLLWTRIMSHITKFVLL